MRHSMQSLYHRRTDGGTPVLTLAADYGPSQIQVAQWWATSGFQSNLNEFVNNF